MCETHGRAGESHAAARLWRRCEAPDLDITIARQAYLPTLTVDAVYGIEANAFALHSTVAANKEIGPVPNLGYFVTASLNIPVWDWGVRRSKVRQAELKQKQAAVELSAAQRTLIQKSARASTTKRKRPASRSICCDARSTWRRRVCA